MHVGKKFLQNQITRRKLRHLVEFVFEKERLQPICLVLKNLIAELEAEHRAGRRGGRGLGGAGGAGGGHTALPLGGSVGPGHRQPSP